MKVTDKDLTLPLKKEPDVVDFEALVDTKCPGCKTKWDFEDQAKETISIRATMCEPSSTIVKCPSCSGSFVIFPASKRELTSKGSQVKASIKGYAIGRLKEDDDG